MIDSLEGTDHKRKIARSKLSAKRDNKWIRTFIRPFNLLKFLNTLSPKKFVFAGSRAHRVDYNQLHWNRFSDSLIETHNLKNDVYQIEYDNADYSNYPLPENFLQYQKPLMGFLRWRGIFSRFGTKTTLEVPNYDAFIAEIEANELANGFHLKVRTSQLRSLADMLEGQIRFFQKVLKRIKPKTVFMLSYYSNTVSFGIIAAANRLNIRTVEIQHGPMSTAHLAYGSWTEIPEKGYQLIPREFWCWDEVTKEFMNTWSGPGKRLYDAYTAGHPWLEYLNTTVNPSEEKIILYTLQPKPLELNQLFTEDMVALIHEQKDLWYVRLHPRMQSQLESIRAFLESKGILKLIHLDEATNSDLPTLLSRSKVHVTHSSGCVLEAHLMGVPSIIINKIGVSYYKSLIQAGDAVSLDYQTKDFKSEFYRLCASLQTRSKNRVTDHSEVVKKLFN